MTLSGPEGTQIVRYPYVVAPGGVVPEGVPGTKSYIFTQRTPHTPWVITHGLDCDPSVSVVVDGEEVDADVTYPSPYQVVITFADPQSGTARLL